MRHTVLKGISAQIVSAQVRVKNDYLAHPFIVYNHRARNVKAEIIDHIQSGLWLT